MQAFFYFSLPAIFAAIRIGQKGFPGQLAQTGHFT
jgi:hypothetical protein